MVPNDDVSADAKRDAPGGNGVWNGEPRNAEKTSLWLRKDESPGRSGPTWAQRGV